MEAFLPGTREICYLNFLSRSGVIALVNNVLLLLNVVYTREEVVEVRHHEAILLANYAATEQFDGTDGRL